MAKPLIVGLSGNTQRPSRTFGLVAALAAAVEARHPAEVELHDLVDCLPELGRTVDPRLADASVRRLIDALEQADALIVGTAVYKGSYAGLFKHLFDLIEPKALAGKPVILAATGGSERHALVVDHALRPLFGFFGAAIVPTGLYATERDFLDGRPAQTSLLERINRAADELGRQLSLKARAPLARIA